MEQDTRGRLKRDLKHQPSLKRRDELERQERILHVFIDVCKNTETVVSVEVASAVSPPAYIMQQTDI